MSLISKTGFDVLNFLTTMHYLTRFHNTVAQDILIVCGDGDRQFIDDFIQRSISARVVDRNGFTHISKYELDRGHRITVQPHDEEIDSKTFNEVNVVWLSSQLPGAVANHIIHNTNHRHQDDNFTIIHGGTFLKKDKL